MEFETFEVPGKVIMGPEYGDRGCEVCVWHDRMGVKGCEWNDPYWIKGGFKKQIYPDCRFMPDTTKIPGMCGNCKHSNCFIYKTKPEYENCKNSHSKAMNDPVDEPNIYCDHHDGSLNRRTAYKDLEQHKFGVGLYHRQHEWDICDRWEEEK